MGTTTNRRRGETYLILLWLPLAGALLAAAAIYLTFGAHGFEFFWGSMWTPGLIGFLVFAALFALLTAFFLLRGLLRCMKHCATKDDSAHNTDQSPSISNKLD